jgi:hypothetical protein
LKLKALALSLLLLCSNLAVALVPQSVVPKARIEGTIFKAGTRDPLSGVQVKLSRVSNYTGPIAGPGGVLSASFSASGPPPPLPGNRGGSAPTVPQALPAIPTVVTDRDGKFLFPDLDAGPYRLYVVAPGYVKQEYGQRTFPGQGTVLTLAAGQVMKDLVMNITLTGNVSGRLRDSSGQLAAGVPVQLLKPAYNSAGQKTFQTAGETRTNDRGEYRIYWVTPGRYFVAAGSPPGPAIGIGRGGQPATPNDPGESYLFSFYPGVTDLSLANSIDISSGNEATADFAVPNQQVYTVHGRVVDSTANVLPQAVTVSMSFAMITGGGASWSMQAPYNAANGTFEIRDVVPGSYTLQVSASKSTSNAIGRVSLEVAANMPEVPVVLGSNFSVPARVRMDGLDQSGVERARIGFRSTNSTANLGSGASAPSADGTFQFENVLPGEYQLTLNGMPPNYYIKEARFDRNDVLNQPLKFTGPAPGGATVEVVISTTVGEITGVITDERSQPVGGVQAVLVPDQHRDRAELFKAATTDQTGRFQIANIVPGDYRLFSWETLESFGYFDPDLLKQSEPLAKAIHIAESSKQQVDVRVIPATK